MFVTPLSCAMICCVRSASVAASAVGSASASSSELVCSDLRAAEHRRQRLQRRPDDVVVGLLRGERHAGGLRVEAQLPRPLVLRAEAVAHHLRPDLARGAELGDLLEEVAVRVEEERDARREVVDVEARRRCRTARTRCRRAA